MVPVKNLILIRPDLLTRLFQKFQVFQDLTFLMDLRKSRSSISLLQLAQFNRIYISRNHR